MAGIKIIVKILIHKIKIIIVLWIIFIIIIIIKDLII